MVSTGARSCVGRAVLASDSISREGGAFLSTCWWVTSAQLLVKAWQWWLREAGPGAFQATDKTEDTPRRLSEMCPGLLWLRLWPTFLPSTEPEGLVGSSSPQPGPLPTESLENDSVEAAEGEQEPDPEALGGTSSEPGTPRPGRSAVRVGGSSHAERRAGVHISGPYDVNLPAHISNMLNISPNNIANISLAGFARGLEHPALQPRPSPASGPGPGPGLGPGPPGKDPRIAQDWEKGLEL